MPREYTITLPRPHTKQAAFVDSEAKRIVVRAGRRGGKTVGVAIRAVKAFLKGKRVLYAAPTQEQIDRFWVSVVRCLQEPIDAGIFHKNETRHIVELPGTEQRIRAKTAWNADTLRGDYADELIPDEWQLMNEEAWGVVGAPTLMDNDGNAIFIYTPPSLSSRSASKADDPQHAAKLFKRAAIDESGRWATFHFKSMDNPHISAEAVQEMAQDMSPQSQPSSDPQQSSLVMSAVRWVSSTLPEAPVEVMKPTEEDDERIKNHKLTKIICEPNPYTDEPTLWKAFAYSWIISGNAYWIKFRNPFGAVVELWNEPFFCIRPRWVNDKKGPYIPAEQSQSLKGIGRNDSSNLFINYYEVDRDNVKFRLEPEDVVHFKDGEDPLNRRLGLSYVMSILREIYGDSAAADYAGGLLANNGIPPFVLSIDDKLGQLRQEDIDGIKARLTQQMRSSGAQRAVSCAVR